MNLREIYNSISVVYNEDLLDILKESTGIKKIDNKLSLVFPWSSDYDNITEELLDEEVVINESLLFWQRSNYLWVIEDIKSIDEYCTRLRILLDSADITRLVRVDNVGITALKGLESNYISSLYSN